MNASEWKAKVIAIGRALAAGDDSPLDILCDQLAAMSEKLHEHEEAKKPKPKTAMVLLGPEPPAIVEIPVIENK